MFNRVTVNKCYDTLKRYRPTAVAFEETIKCGGDKEAGQERQKYDGQQVDRAHFHGCLLKHKKKTLVIVPKNISIDALCKLKF